MGINLFSEHLNPNKIMIMFQLLMIQQFIQMMIYNKSVKWRLKKKTLSMILNFNGIQKLKRIKKLLMKSALKLSLSSKGVMKSGQAFKIKPNNRIDSFAESPYNLKVYSPVGVRQKKNFKMVKNQISFQFSGFKINNNRFSHNFCQDKPQNLWKDKISYFVQNCLHKTN